MSEHEHDELENDIEEDLEEGSEIDMESMEEVFRQLQQETRPQNIELLKLAAEVAGYAGSHNPLKPSEVRHAMNAIWDIYSQFYDWVDPLQHEFEDEDEDEDEDEEDADE